MLLKNKDKTILFDLDMFQSYLGGDIKIINGIPTLNFNNSNGKGRIRYLSFGDGLVTINADLSLLKNFTFPLCNSNIETLHLFRRYLFSFI